MIVFEMRFMFLNHRICRMDSHLCKIMLDSKLILLKGQEAGE